jgi:aspartate aminotransferase-like enzyme
MAGIDGENLMTTQTRKIVAIPQVEPRQPIPLQNLRVPGPTPVPERILAEMARPMINHRGPEFSAIMRRVTTRLQYFFQTASPVLTFPASGTGGQEAAIANLFSTGDHVVAISIGNFGDRLATIASKFGLKVTKIAFEWGQAADPEVVAEKLKTSAPYKSVLVTHNETSTGVANDIEALSRVIREHNPDTLIVVDAVSSLGCLPLEMDPWDLDVVFTGSQKGWMTPPGLMMIAVGPRALEAHKTANLPRFYFDWTLSLKNMEKWQHPTTPPISLFYALDLALELMLEEGRDVIFARHQQAGDYVRNRAKAFGLQLLADHPNASNTVSAILTPEGVETKALLKKLREVDNVVLAGGQGKLDGKIFRLGHLGYFEQEDLAEALDPLEARLLEFGYRK